MFDTLAKGGHVDRRFDPRLDRSLNLDALWDLNGNESPVMLHDYSQGGLCVRASQPGRTGERFHLRLADPYNLIIVAAAVWQLKVIDGFLIGCSFLNDRDFDRLEQLVESTNAIDSARCL